MAAPLNKNNSVQVDRVENFGGKEQAFDGKQKIAGSLVAQEESNLIFDDFIKKMRMDPLSYRPLIAKVEEDEPKLQKPSLIATDDDIKEKVYDLNLSEELQEQMEKWLKELLNDLKKLQDTYVANMGRHIRSFASEMVTYGHVSEQAAWQNALDIEQVVTDVYEDYRTAQQLEDIYALASAPPQEPDVTPSAPLDPDSIPDEVTATLVTSDTADPNATDAGFGKYLPTPKPSVTSKRELTEEEKSKILVESFTKKLLDKDNEMKTQGSAGVFNTANPDVFRRQVDFAANSFVEKVSLTALMTQTVHAYVQKNPELEATVKSIEATRSSLPTLNPKGPPA